MWANWIHDWANNPDNLDSTAKVQRRATEKTELNNENDAKFKDKWYWEKIQTILSPLLSNEETWPWITDTDIKNIEKKVKIKYKWEDNFDLKSAITEKILWKVWPLWWSVFVFENWPKVENSAWYKQFQQETVEYAKDMYNNINFEGFNSEESKAIEHLDSVWRNQWAITANDEQKWEKELPAKETVLPEKYDSVEAAPDSCKKAVWETCDTVKGLIDEQFIDENFKQLSSHTINDPRTSVMGRLVESWELSNETNEAINQNIANDWEFDKKFEKTVSNRKDLTKLQNTLKLIPESKDAVPVKNITSFKEDFPDLADIAINWDEATSLGDWEKLDSSEISAYGHISENYIKIWDSPEDKAKNYSTAIKTAGANLLKNDTVIKRDTVEFKAALNSIHSDNPERQFEWLSSLISIKETEKIDNAAKWAKISKRSKNSTKTRLKLTEDLDKIREEFTALKKVASSENLQKRKDLWERWREIQELLKKDTPKWWEAMSGWKHDALKWTAQLKEAA